MVGQYIGRPAFVLGGGPSLPAAYASLVADEDAAVLISANQHGCMLAEQQATRFPDYIVAVDEIEHLLRPYRVPVIAARAWADVPMFGKPVHQSGMLGCFVAWVMGCAPIVPLGMDLYRAGTYWHEPGAFSTGNKISFEELLARWARLKDAIGGDDVVRVPPGSPLEAHFPAFDCCEVVQSGATNAERLAALEVPRMVMLREHPTVRGVRLRAGDIVRVSRPARASLLRARLAVDAA